MNTTINRAYSAFDNFEKATAHDAAAALRQLVADLSLTRENVSSEDWKDCCTAISTHRAFDQLLQDPYTRDARGKPSGYAGDARTLDYVYLRNSGSQQMTDIGNTFFNISTGVAIADAVRARCVHIAQILINQFFQHIGILSLEFHVDKLSRPLL